MKLAFRKRSETKSSVELIPKSEACREGRRRSADDWSYTLDVNDQALFAGRGFTGHSLSREERNGKHLPEFGLINMNGRLYDPLLGRFLSPDNNVQLPDFSQNFNRYSYCLNNPLKYTDPEGESLILLAAILGGWIGMGQAMISSDKDGLGLVGDMFKGLFVGAAASAAGAWAGGAAVGALFSQPASTFGGFVVQGAVGGFAGGALGGFVGGAGNAWMGGASFGQGLQYGLIGGGYGALGGALIGGISGGIQYQRQISVFQKGCVDLGVNGGDPVPATDQFLSDAQKAWYKDAPMNNVKAFTVENVPSQTQARMDAYNAPAATKPLSFSKTGKLTGMSNVYFNKNLAFSSAKQLFFTMGHEFIHVSQFAALAGQSSSILTPDFLDMLDFHAYSYQNLLGGLKLNSYTREEILRWSTAYSQFNSMNYINFPWSFKHSFVYPF